jgi:hypothetical protein
MSVPNTFASATSSIPLANLDANFAYYDAAFSISGTAVTFAGNITLTSGTANGVAYLNGSKVLTTGAALTFNGTTLGVQQELVVGKASFPGSQSFRSTAVVSGFDVGLIGGDGDNTGYIYNRSAGGIVFGANNAEQMRLTSTGLGIGTSTPAAKLDVTGTTFSRFINSTAPTLSNDTHAGEAVFLRSGGTAGSGNVQAVLAFGKADSSSLRSGSAIASIQTTADTDQIGLGFYVSTSSASVQTMSQAAIIDASGNVGIGTSSPSQKLEVASTSGAAGSALLRLTSTGSVGMEAGLEFFTTPTDTTAATRAGRIYAAYDGGSYASSRLSFQSMTAGNVLVDTMHLKAGNVGIGTTTPVGRLSVIGGSDNATQVVINGSTGTTARGLRIATGTTGFQANDTAILDAQHPTNAALVFQTGSTERMRIDASGNVGIGTASPSAVGGYNSLTVNGTSGSLVDSFLNGTLTGRIQAYATGYALLAQGAATPLIFGTNNTERMRLDSSGNLLVGLTSATGVAKLQVSGAIRTTGFTVATLPAGTVGMRTYVTDALAPSFSATVVGGGAVTIPVFYNGTNWIVA